MQRVPKEKGNMALSISNIAWNPDQDESVAKLLKIKNVHCIDIAPGKYFRDLRQTPLEDVLNIKRFWASYDISIIGMQSLFFGTCGYNVFGPTHVEMLSYLRRVCTVASVLGIKFLTFGSPKNRDCTGLSTSETWDMALSFFYEVGKIAKNSDVTICLEPNPKEYGANFLTTTEDAAFFVKQLNHPNIGLQLDTGTLSLNNENPSIIRKVQDVIKHIHISEPYLKPLSEMQERHLLYSPYVKHLKCYKTIEMLTDGCKDTLCTLHQSLTFAQKLYL